ncbi:hypothetical protein BTO20_05800 [Mycobacterium dioxanotrophicus]|jgi:hypothetical protein|uniref:Uncharacterized protein n=1 Tax=Mycobacterium dioxanotrophicus TaxID=482462 RepID=A0A1Y0BZ63_9MYCO|nr:hypothetical protein [Mycobacterium dioxanotrophicus]ART68166.1 hypothetical protein BTO20_05800 [Mycobacterium dioxanotrophicus]
MTALQPVWTPADFDATVAAAALHEPVAAVPAATRGRRYRGRHRANRFSRRVTDLQTEIREEQAYDEFRRNLAFVLRSLRPGGAQ